MNLSNKLSKWKLEDCQIDLVCGRHLEENKKVSEVLRFPLELTFLQPLMHGNVPLDDHIDQ